MQVIFLDYLDQDEIKTNYNGYYRDNWQNLNMDNGLGNSLY